MKLLKEGILESTISMFKKDEEVHVVATVKGSQFKSGMGYVVVSQKPPFKTLCIDSLFIKGEQENLMELGEFSFPLYKGLFTGECLKSNDLVALDVHREVYVLAKIESVAFHQETGYIVAHKKMIDSASFSSNRGFHEYEPFIVDSKDLLFEFDSFVPTIKEPANIF